MILAVALFNKQRQHERRKGKKNGPRKKKQQTGWNMAVMNEDGGILCNVTVILFF